MTTTISKRVYSIFLTIIVTIGMVLSPILSTNSLAATSGAQVVAEARRWCGITKYVDNGNSLTNGADCSGFVCCIFENCGINYWSWRSDFIGGLSNIGINAGTNSSNAKAGDIIVWPGHVGIAVDNKTVIQCQCSTGATERDYAYMQRWFGNIKMIIRPNALSSQSSSNTSSSSSGYTCIQNGTYRIKATNGSGKYVSVTPNQRYSGGNIALYSKGKGDQLFTFKRNSDGTYTISSGVYCLDVRGAAYKGTVQLYWANGTAAQKWTVVSLGNGNYRLVNKAHNLVMDISGNSTANGADIHTWESNGTSAQVFKLERVS